MATSKAIVLVGSRWHDPWVGGEILKRLLQDVGLASLRTDQGSILTPERLAQTPLVVFYCDGRWIPDDPESRRLTPEQEANLVRYVTAGGGLLGVHGAAVFREEYAQYPQMLGGRFLRHDKQGEFTVKIQNPNHPITRGVSDYAVFDEPYEVEWYPGSELLLAGEWGGQRRPLGWAKSHCQGRVCYLANGHDKRSLEHPAFQQLFRNAARWCAKVG